MTEGAETKRAIFLKGFNRLTKRQIAKISNDPLIAGGVTLGGKVRLLSRDAILRDKGGGSLFRALDLYYDLFTDMVVFSSWDKQATDIVSREWIVEPGGKEDIDLRAADFARENLEDLGSHVEYGIRIAEDRPCSGFDHLTRGLLVATIAGIATGEIIWGVNRKGQIIPAEIPIRDSRRFMFEYEAKRDKIRPKLLTRGTFNEGILLPARKFIFHRYYAMPGFSDPHGFGLGRQLFYPVEWKKEAIIMWLNLIDKYIDPVTIGTHPAEADKDEVREFKDHIQTIAQEMSITMPEGWSIEFNRAEINGSYDALVQLLEYLDKQISKVITGEATVGEPLGGSQARETINNSIRVQKAKAWSDQLSETLNCTLLKWMTELNFPGARPPKVWREFGDEDGLKDIATVLTLLNQLEYKADPNWIEIKTGIPQAPKATSAGLGIQPKNPLETIEAFNTGKSTLPTEEEADSPPPEEDQSPNS